MKIYDYIMGKTNSSFAYKMLKENILKLELKPGEELKEPYLSEILEMSRTPIREALILLKHEKLIETFPQSGTFVAKIDKEKFKNGRMLRVCIETKMLELACESFPDEYLKQLEENLGKQEYILNTTRDYVEFHKLDLEFHKIIFQGVGYLDLFDITNSNFFDYLRVRQLNSSDKIKDNYVLNGHKKIYEIIKNKTPNIIEETLTNHFSRLGDKLDFLIEEYPFYFK
ncbi:GntR family transcriptional regulator [uncultured Fusobacterium sp.]|jgi:DNA-binding GntR family transcriptional regulator|uniref:GntR family transcriptional regulator n=1 Tax=uncultured Fusobacterium sp. TaxID=159267 RepID=UPI0025EDC756|nr:GntR family transcriptional regulator [uncultured Fusobacterium sp.]